MSLQLFTTKKSASRPSAPPPVELRTELIGRPASGKTALRNAINNRVLNQHLPSGLYLGSKSPDAVAASIQEEIALKRDLQNGGLESTQFATAYENVLEDGERTCVIFRQHEAIGQVLVTTTPDSPPDQRRLYEQLVERLRNSNVLWAIMSAPPPQPTTEDRERFAYDLKLITSYLREALRLRPIDRPCGVAIVLTKIDTLFQNEEAARRELTPDVLQGALQSLAATAVNASTVRQAAIIPVSSLGWNRAERNDQPARYADANWVLRQDASLAPFNVDGLMIWSLLAGLLHQPFDSGTEQEEMLKRVYALLQNDLATTAPWIVPLKGHK